MMSGGTTVLPLQSRGRARWVLFRENKGLAIVTAHAPDPERHLATTPVGQGTRTPVSTGLSPDADAKRSDR